SNYTTLVNAMSTGPNERVARPVGAKGKMRVEWLHEVGQGYLALVRAPWAYLVMLALALWQHRRATVLERRNLGQRVTRQAGIFWLGAGVSAVASVFISCGLAALSLPVGQDAVYWLWGATLVLLAVDSRLGSTAYAAPVLAVIQGVVAWVQSAGGAAPRWLTTDTLADAASLLAVAGALVLVEGILVWAIGWRSASPVAVLGRRGQRVGGYVSHKLWAAPIVAPGPLTAFGHAPLLGTAGMVPMPAVFGTWSLSMRNLPRHTARQLSWPLLALGAAVAVGAYYARHSVWQIAVVGLLCAGLHALIHALVQRSERAGAAIVAQPKEGVRILAVLPRSPAERMGLKPGETLIKVAGMAVNSTYDIHFAVDRSPAYVKVEVQDLAGESRFAGTSLFAADPHLLGVIAVVQAAVASDAQLAGAHQVTRLFRLWQSLRKTAPAFVQGDAAGGA
ncbi:MAG: PDZ domain-containing protein, partial [Firmicutes bacterium]|nr:PDZ domain-containing protein [Bacillota bacterium]